MSHSTQPQRVGKPDEAGLAVARAVQAATSPDIVILFGSRARGDHRPGSDVDLLIVCRQGTVAPRSRAKKAVKRHFQCQEPAFNVDIVVMERDKFDYCQRAKNHIAAQALRDGVAMSDERLNYSGQYEDDYSNSWPDVKERLQAAYRHMGTFTREIEHPEGEQESYGFHAQQAVENAMKAWMSAAEIDYRRVHDLEESAEKLLWDPVESRTPAATQLSILMEYTRFEEPNHPGEYDNWLNRYAVDYRYSGTGFRMTDLDRDRFRTEINLAVQTFVNRAYELTGTDETDLSQ